MEFCATFTKASQLRTTETDYCIKSMLLINFVGCFTVVLHIVQFQILTSISNAGMTVPDSHISNASMPSCRHSQHFVEPKIAPMLSFTNQNSQVLTKQSLLSPYAYTGTAYFDQAGNCLSNVYPYTTDNMFI